MSYHISHVEVIGKDANALREFYGSIFDWQIQAIPEMNYNMVNAHEPAASVGIGSSDDMNYVTFYVAVPDLQATLNKVEQNGGKTIMPPTEIPGYVTMAMFTDPEGHVIGLIKG